MSSDNFWDLFAETGDIGYYLLYIETSGNNGAERTQQVAGPGTVRGENCRLARR